MEAQPGSASFHIDVAGFNEAIAANKRKSDRQHLIVSILRDFCIVVFGILLPIYFLLYDTPPEFSVQLPAIKGLDMPASAAAAAPGSPLSISPAFNVTLHASNRRATRRCYHNGEALVSYAGFTLATGRVPGFCVPAKGAREIRFPASADGVGLPEHVLDRMAREGHAGAVELDVDVRLFRRDDRSNRPTWIWCGLRMDATTQPPNVAPCTVLGLQNWFSTNLYG
ncbi:unnamed protein product [Urochloa decumbens]|uniref:Late embryogenesis abundant protein LEA-2 subgroup domain-containing protein n=1 Tax=Urochloa decumbens TaxID=240449 RepID=A0ABC9DG82_9POAL